MEVNFNVPQRQSPIGVLVMFANTLQHYIKAFWPLLLIWVFQSDKMNKTYVLIGIVALVVVIGVIAYLKYLNFTFYIDDENDEFIINEGIVNKTKTTIQLNKIQQVNINQSFIQRIIGVYSLDVDTAGSTNKEGKIRAISHELAIALKSKLIDNEKKVVVSTEAITSDAVLEEKPTQHPFLEISFLSLLKIGITSNYIKSLGLLLTFFFTIYHNIKDVANNADIDTKIDNFIDENAVMNSVSILIIGLLLVVFVINVLRTVIRYFGFKVTKQTGSLLLSYGLIDTKSTILKPEKVQIVSVSRNYLQKKLDVLQMKIQQATGEDSKSKRAIIEIPGCNTNESNEILKLLFSQLPQKGVMLQPNWRKLGFALFLFIVLPVTAFFTFGNYVEKSVLEYAYFSIVYVIFIGLIIYFGYRNYRLFVNNDFIIKQSGAWDIENQIIELHKIQAITTSQLFWHKLINVGSITLHTAGGNIGFHLGDYTKIKEYVNLWLYEIETSNSNWM
ncbi:MAG: PH domain-containing protein [Bacteroidota bacterium]